MRSFLLFRQIGRKATPNNIYESFKNGFKEPETEFLKDKDFFKGYEEVVDVPELVSPRGMLTICPTPIGNLRDISIRQYQALKSADILACEDTRLTGLLLLLLKDLNFSESASLEFPPQSIPDTPELDEFTYCLTEDFLTHTVQTIKKNREEKGRGIMISLNSYNQEQRTPKLIKAMKSGIRVVMVSDAGTPLVSDPGLILVREAVKNGISIESLPGPVAAITALTLSGFPTDNFFFQGYMPKTLSEKVERLERMKSSACTSLIYESSHRILKTAETICSVFGDLHQVFVAQELTKMHERFYRGSALEVLKQLKEENASKGKIYGEITVALAPFNAVKKESVVEVDIQELIEALNTYVQAKPKVLSKVIHSVTGWGPKKVARIIYEQNQEEEERNTPETWDDKLAEADAQRVEKRIADFENHMKGVEKK